MNTKKKTLIENKKKMINYQSTKQITLDYFPNQLLQKAKQIPNSFILVNLKDDKKKEIVIHEISLVSDIKRNELNLKVNFGVLPSKTFFSIIRANLWFDKKRLKLKVT